MNELSKEEIADYVADMAQQLAIMCQESLPVVTALLRTASKVADQSKGTELSR